MTANLLYVIYGLMLHALPMAIGGSIAALIHFYWIRRLVIDRNKNNTQIEQ